MDAQLLQQAVSYGDNNAGAGFIIRHGLLVRAFGNTDARREVKSATKSFGSLLLASRCPMAGWLSEMPRRCIFR